MAPTPKSPLDKAPAGEYYKVETPKAGADLSVQVFKEDDATKLKKKDDKDTNSESGASTEAASDKKKRRGPPRRGPGGPKSFAFGSLYRYATPFDKLLLCIGILFAVFNGALFPMMAIVFGNMLTGFSKTPIDMDSINAAALDYFLIACGMFVSDYAAYITFYYTAERQMKYLRSESLKHMLYLDISWYDQNDALQLSSRLSGDTVKIKDGMGQKLGDLFRFTTQFFVGFIIGFSRGWDITLVMAAVMPFMALSMTWLIKMMRSKSEWAQAVYAEAGAIAEETLSQIRTVASLNAEKKALGKYIAHVKNAESENINLAKYTSAVFAMFLGSMWVMYAAGLWYGGHKVSKAETTPAKVFQAFFGILMGSASLAQISPNLTAVAQATGSCQALFKILDTKPTIDASKETGIIPERCDGAIEVKDVHFTYPTRSEAPVLVDYNLSIAAGQTVAFVGSSGGGKSTLVALLERFYDPQSGTITLDGVDIKDLNVRWLREQIGIVQQEPVLFQTTILENIATGAKDVTREQAIEAAKMANAHNFIMELPQGYDTLVGEKGVSLSGGQKQRVAIARAVVRNPKILVLDEATSALDNESERIVQAALNELMDKTSMTTLVIAHRLSTVRHADKIVVLQSGHIVETGTHDELVLLEGGIYKTMYQLQELKAKEGDDDDEDEVAHVESAEATRRDSFVSTESDKSIVHVENNKTERPKFTILDIFRLSKPERKFFYTGMLGACVSGCALPCSAILVSGMITSMTVKYGEYERSGDRKFLSSLYKDVSFYGACYLIGAVILMCFIFMQFFSFKYMMEKLTTRMRDVNFSALCRQNVGFFDEKENATGALTADLNTNATKVAMLSGDSQARLVQAFFTLIAAILISFLTGSWLLTLIMLAVFPLLIGGQYIRMRQIHRRDAISDELAEPGAHASERLANIRTVVSLGLEKSSAAKFHDLLEEPFQKGHMQAQINGIALGYSSFIMMAVYALVFWYGAKLVERGDASFGEVIRTLMAIMMSLQGVTGAASYFGDAEAAVKAGATIMAIQNREVSINSFGEDGLRPAVVQGKLEFKNISFRYPTRPAISVLKRYNLTIEAGQTVAFCGPSGGGKSTIISLIERFYDPIRGDVFLDGNNLKDINVQWLRDQIGLVGQEPVLFSGTIAENIAYGLSTEATQDEIEAAAKMANAHDYISQFPDGYKTQVGNKGEQLSGGQKQRIAIARAILKNPNILLLDEATSALDSESEKVVQDALDKVVALKRRTTIIIAHRLSTIRKADKICVVSGGHIAESGTHNELLAKNGLYANLVNSATA